MLVSYKEKKFLILSVVSLLLDGLISYYLPSYLNSSTIFFPMLTISLIPFLYNKNTKDYYTFCFVLGIIYDLLYSNIFLFHGLLFLILAKINTKILKSIKNSLLLYLILLFINILFYDSILFLLVSFTNYASVSIMDLVLKIRNSLFINTLSVFVYYFLFKKRKVYS